jgi:hypothetical protein
LEHYDRIKVHGHSSKVDEGVADKFALLKFKRSHRQIPFLKLAFQQCHDVTLQQTDPLPKCSGSSNLKSAMFQSEMFQLWISAVRWPTMACKARNYDKRQQ